MLKLSRKPVALFLNDGSVIVTALLFAFTISPFAPWWVILIGIFFAVVIAKHLYGGLGFNPFNPAMAGFVFVLLCFPSQMNVWPAAPGISEIKPDISTYIAMIFQTGSLEKNTIDAISGASPLNDMKSQLSLMAMVSEIDESPIYGNFAGKGWEVINIALLAGGIFMLLAGIIRWHIPVAVLTGLFMTSLFFYAIDAETYASPVFHLCAGGTMLAAFFIATDPVTAPATPRGRLVYGFMIGMTAYIIRNWGGYPDGFAFAVLIANSAAPIISYYTVPKVVGENVS